jgi:hypothetical protein
MAFKVDSQVTAARDLGSPWKGQVRKGTSGTVTKVNTSLWSGKMSYNVVFKNGTRLTEVAEADLKPAKSSWF